MMLLLVFILSILPASGWGQDNGRTLRGRVQKVIDGDSIILRQGSRNYEVRLWGIDCPEYGQPYGASAGKLSRALLLHKNARVKIQSRDSYGRYVGIVSLGNINVNEELVRQGAAWVYNHYCRESICNEWNLLEDRARSERRGLWKAKKQVAPWKWRWENR